MCKTPYPNTNLSLNIKHNQTWGKPPNPNTTLNTNHQADNFKHIEQYQQQLPSRKILKYRIQILMKKKHNNTGHWNHVKFCCKSSFYIILQGTLFICFMIYLKRLKQITKRTDQHVWHFKFHSVKFVHKHR